MLQNKLQRTMVTRWANSLICYWTSHMIHAWAVGCPCYLCLDILFVADFSIAFFFSAFKRAYRRYEKKVFQYIKLQGRMPAWLTALATARSASFYVFLTSNIVGTGPVARRTQLVAVHPVHIWNLQNVKARYSDQNAEIFATNCHIHALFFLN